ncbi:MAG: flagellar hook protein FlgE [Planctomycetota bacterium]|jgi:flagellar hook protein FlgE
MSLTNAMYTGFSGIDANTTGVDTVGNNLANLNTTAYKAQRTLFEDTLYHTISEGSGPDATTGGTLPRQVGTGTTVSAIQRNFNQGGLNATGVEDDLAVVGEGFFVLELDDGSQGYTRDGAFTLVNEQLVSTSGYALLGFSADDEGVIDTSTLTPLNIPLGSIGDPIQTTNVEMEGKLDGATEVASAEGVQVSAPLVTGDGSAATVNTALTSLVDAFGVPLFADGDVVTVGGEKGGITVNPAQFVVGTTGSTVGEFARHLETVLGINTDPATGGAPGVTIGDGTTAAAGSLVIRSNLGEINEVVLDSGSIVNETGVIASPFSWDTAQEAVGGGFEGATTSFNVFDSLGNPVDVRLRFVAEERTSGGNTWRFYAESNADTDLSPVIGTGTVSFDTTGRFVSAENTNLSIDRAGVGSGNPVDFNLDLTTLSGVSSADGSIEVSMADQDGKPAGIMTGYTIDNDGIVTGEFSNTDSQVLGQVALATFVNNEGLIAEGENIFVESSSSGDATIGAPQEGIAGSVQATYLEESNVEISREFINLISYSTGISASSRVVRASDELLQELLLLAR